LLFTPVFINTFITFPFSDNTRQHASTLLDCYITFSLVAAATSAAQVPVRTEKCVNQPDLSG
jgi:hypothetical protein